MAESLIAILRGALLGATVAVVFMAIGALIGWAFVSLSWAIYDRVKGCRG